LQVEYEQAIREEDVVKMLFRHSDSAKAARTFIDWLKSKKGVCSHSEMSDFSHRLASGELRSRLSRTNFYRTVLHNFINSGLIAEQPSYDHKSRKIVKVYRIVLQPVTKHKPMSPSFIHLAHLVGKKWNAEFIES